MIPALFEMDSMYRVFNFIAVRVMIAGYIRRELSSTLRVRGKDKYVSELAKQFTNGIERKNHD